MKRSPPVVLLVTLVSGLFGCPLPERWPPRPDAPVPPNIGGQPRQPSRTEQSARQDPRSATPRAHETGDLQQR